MLSRRLARGAATNKQLEDAFHSRLAVEGRIERDVKGGYEVRIGGQRAFCPFSQIDTVRTSDPAQHIGRVYEFRIVEYREGGRNIVVSRRALLEEQQRAGAAGVRRSIVAGAILTGRVASVREFGAFVDLGAGVQGLLHVSEMGWSRVSDTSQVVTPGQEITVKVLRVDDSTQKIALGLKQLTADPGQRAVDLRGGPGAHRPRDAPDRVRGVRRARAGIEGLAHASTFAPTGHSKGWSRSVAVGMTAAFEILNIDLEKKRIGVALVEEGSTPEAGAMPPKSEIRAWRAGQRQGRASREVRGVRVPRAGPHRSDAVERDRL
jgi:small subunit ribosomal protein S1